MTTMNDQLKDLYISKFSEGTPCFLQQLREKRRHENSKEQPAYPLLLKINEENYRNADLRIMIFGQETNSWEHEVSSVLIPMDQSIDFTGQTVDIFMDHYGRFLNNKLTQKGIQSPFWIGYNEIYKSFKDIKGEIVWNNIYKIGNKLKGQNRPHETTRHMENVSFDVISKEIEILKPDVLVFLTGPNYDPRVNKKFQINEKKEFPSGVPIRELAKISLANEIIAYRTYHPNHLQRKGMDYLKQIIIDIKGSKVLETLSKS